MSTSPVLSLRERLRAKRRAESGSAPLVLVIATPEPVQATTRAPRVSITQPTDATESATLRAIKAREKPAVRACSICGQSFQPAMPHQVRCGKTACMRGQRSEWARERRETVKVAKPETVTCPVCETTFDVDRARRGQAHRRYCSGRCREFASNRGLTKTKEGQAMGP